MMGYFYRNIFYGIEIFMVAEIRLVLYSQHPLGNDIKNRPSCLYLFVHMIFLVWSNPCVYLPNTYSKKLEFLLCQAFSLWYIHQHFLLHWFKALWVHICQMLGSRDLDLIILSQMYKFVLCLLEYYRYLKMPDKCLY